MKKKLMKVLVLSLATTLTVGMTSVSTFAIDKNISNSLSSVSIPSVSGYNIEDSGLNSKVIATLRKGSRASEQWCICRCYKEYIHQVQRKSGTGSDL